MRLSPWRCDGSWASPDKLAPLEPHGDRQIDFAITTDSTGFAPSPTIFHVVFMQYDRLVIMVIVNEDSLGPKARNGITQAGLRGAVRTVEAALGTG